ncbi:VOC family protein [Cohnella silvisoli]|uniref:VOC family protein n=1 Tax=Cohnella silvisoli TaxID=2873699 RepID=A0ABV1L0C0_9BACL|nr:VOC family protein [Cohnella silvisoli]MCD9025119.1 VOC family protein [Cohnella silvisoli]
MALTATQTYVNLHVQNVKQSMAFFTGLGFEFNMQFTDEEKAACIVIGDNMFVMLTNEEYFKSLTQKEIVDTDKYAQLTLALFVESRDKVDEIVNTAASLGGKIITDPEDYGFMYQWGFQDLDGHMWAIGAA